jgi:inner membrane protein
MPSPIAHAVTGYCLGQVWLAAFVPASLTRKKQRTLLGMSTFAAVAADADFLPQLLFDTSFHRGISHSLGIGVVCSIVLALLMFRGSRRVFYSAALGFTAYAVHLCMDLLTTGGRGIPVFWPITAQLIQSPTKIFPQVHHSEGLFYSGHIPVLLFELTFSILLLWLTKQGIQLFPKTKGHQDIRTYTKSHDSTFLGHHSNIRKTSQTSSRN